MTKEEIQKNSEHWYNKYKQAQSQLTEKDKQIASYLEMLAKETEKYVPISKRETVWEKSLSQQLTKAKELLNEFMRISKASDEDFEHDYSELIGETEQFLNREVKE